MLANPKQRKVVKARRAAKGCVFSAEQPVIVERVNALIRRLPADHDDVRILNLVLSQSYFDSEVDGPTFKHKVSYMACKKDADRILFESNFKGRLSAHPKAPCLATMSRASRGFLFEGVLRDLDIRCAGPTIMLHLMKVNGVEALRCKELEHYIANRDQVHASVMATLSVDNDQVKQTVTSIMYGCKDYSQNLGGRRVPVLDALSQEMANAYHILKDKPCFKSTHDWARQYVVDCYAQDVTKNIVGVFMSTIGMDMELKLAMAARDRLHKIGIECCAYAYDGLMVPYGAVEPTLLQELSDAGFAKTGCRVTWVEKPVRAPVVPKREVCGLKEGAIKWHKEGEHLKYAGDDDYDKNEEVQKMRESWDKCTTIVDHPEKTVKDLDYSEPRFAPYSDRLLFHGIQCNMGGQKSSRTNEAAKSGSLGRCLYILTRRVLTWDFVAKLQGTGVHYLANTDNLEGRHYVTTFQSLLKLREKYASNMERFPFETIVIDEVRTFCATVCCTQTNAGYMLKQRQRFFRLVLELPTTKRVILLDADLMVDTAVLWFYHYFAPKSRRPGFVVDRYNGVSLDRTVLDMGSQEFCEALTSDIEEAVHTNQTIFIPCRLKTNAVYWERVASNLGARVKMYISDPIEDENAGQLSDWSTMDEALERGDFAHVVIYTCVCSVGVSCDYPIWRIYGDFQGRGGPDAREGCQLFARGRKPRDTVLRVCFGDNAPTDARVTVDDILQMKDDQRAAIMNELHLYCDGESEGATVSSDGLFAPDMLSHISVMVAREHKTSFKSYCLHICNRQGFSIYKSEEKAAIETDIRRERDSLDFSVALHDDVKQNKKRLETIAVDRRKRLFEEEVKPMWERCGKRKRGFDSETNGARCELPANPSAEDLAKLSVLNTCAKYVHDDRDLNLDVEVAHKHGKKIRNLAYFSKFDLEPCRKAWLCKTRIQRKNTQEARRQGEPELIDNDDPDVFLDLEYETLNAELFPLCAGLQAVCDDMKIDKSTLLDPEKAATVRLPGEMFDESHEVGQSIVKNLSARVKTKSTDPASLLRNAVRNTFGTKLKKDRAMVDKKYAYWFSFEPNRELYNLSRESTYLTEVTREVTVRVTTRRIEERRAREK